MIYKSNNRRRRLLLLRLSIASLCFAGGVSAGQEVASGVAACGTLQNAYGPYDYSDAAHRVEYLPVVETHHFNEDVRELRSGMSGTLTADIEYVLRAFPNHHLALDAIARLYRREKPAGVLGSRSLTCWFDRARRMSPSDGMVPMIHGIHFFYLGDFAKAKEQFLEAADLMPDSPEVQYNLGLVYVKLREYEAARTSAKHAYAAGYPLGGLRDQLRRAGEWQEE